MDISEIRVKLVDNRKERLLAFCTVTFHREFVVRDVKIIDGPRGPFIAMPSRKVMDRCHGCGSKNHLRAGYCNDCGCELNENRAPKDARGRPRLHVDVGHVSRCGRAPHSGRRRRRSHRSMGISGIERHGSLLGELRLPE